MKDGKVVKEGPTNEVINTKVLKEIYGFNINIHEINGKSICLYYG